MGGKQLLQKNGCSGGSWHLPGHSRQGMEGTIGGQRREGLRAVLGVEEAWWGTEGGRERERDRGVGRNMREVVEGGV